MAKWLLKSEPKTFSIDDLQRERVTLWDGVRNYQARNFLKEMQVGDLALFYHSNSNPPGVVGLCQVVRAALADPTQFDKRSEYFDAKSSSEAPRWFCPELEFVGKFPTLIPLAALREQPACDGMLLLKKGTRLSVQPVSESEYRAILRLVS